MIAVLATAIAALLEASEASGAGAGVARFDGLWTTTVSCPAASDAMGYSFEVPTEVKAGVLHGERLQPGQAGHLLIDGQIRNDGHAELYAKGMVGAAQFAVGQRPKGTDYGYHVVAQFKESQGTGSRVEGRRCDLVFARR